MNNSLLTALHKRVHEWHRPHLSAILFSIVAFGCEAPVPTDAGTDSAVPSSPEIYAPQVISTGLGERDITFSPDMNQMFYTIWSGAFGTIVCSERNGSGGWETPRTASFSGHYSDMEPFISGDGSRLFFASNRPLGPGEPTKDFDIWYVDRSADGWSAPVHMNDQVNTTANEFYPSVSSNGNLYFTAARPDAVGGEDIFMSPLVDGEYGPPNSLGIPVNSELDEFNAHISPDETRLVYTIWGRENDFGGGDLYMARKNSEGAWQEPVNLGDKINTRFLDFCPAFSPDGSQFFFTSRRTNLDSQSEQQRSYAWLAEALTSSGNGAGDIYWVDSTVLDSIVVPER